jgi:hypothetical protein
MKLKYYANNNVGARGYFLYYILHDWLDKYCYLILKATQSAIRPGYLKLLIYGLILPDTGAQEIRRASTSS